MMQIDLSRFNNEIARLKTVTGRNACSVVRFWSQKLVRQLAFATPIAHGHYSNRGRARAGWWPAASSVGVSNVYTPHVNAGEGAAINKIQGANPSFVMRNTVPYITKLQINTTAISAKMQSMARADLIRSMSGALR